MASGWPEKRRVDAGALLYTAAPMGLFLATFIVFQIQGVYFRGTPEVAWRYVFLSGLIPAFVAILESYINAILRFHLFSAIHA